MFAGQTRKYAASQRGFLRIISGHKTLGSYLRNQGPPVASDAVWEETATVFGEAQRFRARYGTIVGVFFTDEVPAAVEAGRAWLPLSS